MLAVLLLACAPTITLCQCCTCTNNDYGHRVLLNNPHCNLSAYSSSPACVSTLQCCATHLTLDYGRLCILGVAFKSDMPSYTQSLKNTTPYIVNLAIHTQVRVNTINTRPMCAPSPHTRHTLLTLLTHRRPHGSIMRFGHCSVSAGGQQQPTCMVPHMTGPAVSNGKSKLGAAPTLI